MFKYAVLIVLLFIITGTATAYAPPFSLYFTRPDGNLSIHDCYPVREPVGTYTVMVQHEDAVAYYNCEATYEIQEPAAVEPDIGVILAYDSGAMRRN